MIAVRVNLRRRRAVSGRTVIDNKTNNRILSLIDLAASSQPTLGTGPSPLTDG